MSEEKRLDITKRLWLETSEFIDDITLSYEEVREDTWYGTTIVDVDINEETAKKIVRFFLDKFPNVLVGV